jgi:putative ABC transport system permease protein
MGAAERISANDVTPGFLRLLGVVPVLGPSFQSEDIGHPLVILSHAFWRGKFGADPRVIGRDIILGAQTHTVIGVLPEKFQFELNPSDVWRPPPVYAAEAVRAGYRVNVIARLAPHASLASLSAALDEVSRSASPPAQTVHSPHSTPSESPIRRT